MIEQIDLHLFYQHKTKEIPVFVENIGVFAYYSDVSELKSSSPKRRESI